MLLTAFDCTGLAAKYIWPSNLVCLRLTASNSIAAGSFYCLSLGNSDSFRQGLNSEDSACIAGYQCTHCNNYAAKFALYRFTNYWRLQWSSAQSTVSEKRQDAPCYPEMRSKPLKLGQMSRRIKIKCISYLHPPRIKYIFSLFHTLTVNDCEWSQWTFRVDVTLSTWRPWRHFTQISAAIRWVRRRLLHMQFCSSWSIVHSYPIRTVASFSGGTKKNQRISSAI